MSCTIPGIASLAFGIDTTGRANDAGKTQNHKTVIIARIPRIMTIINKYGYNYSNNHHNNCGSGQLSDCFGVG